jgi:hypothetical protein
MTYTLRRRLLLTMGAALAAPAVARSQATIPQGTIRILVGYP